MLSWNLYEDAHVIRVRMMHRHIVEFKKISAALHRIHLFVLIRNMPRSVISM